MGASIFRTEVPHGRSLAHRSLVRSPRSPQSTRSPASAVRHAGPDGARHAARGQGGERHFPVRPGPRRRTRPFARLHPRQNPLGAPLFPIPPPDRPPRLRGRPLPLGRGANGGRRTADRPAGERRIGGRLLRRQVSAREPRRRRPRPASGLGLRPQVRGRPRPDPRRRQDQRAQGRPRVAGDPAGPGEGRRRRRHVLPARRVREDRRRRGRLRVVRQGKPAGPGGRRRRRARLRGGGAGNRRRLFPPMASRSSRRRTRSPPR